MQKKMDLRFELYLVLAVVGAISLFGGLVLVWYTFQMQHLLTGLLERNIAAFQAAEAMDTALINQRGFVTYYFMDGDPDWLRQLGEHRRLFIQRLEETRLLAENQEQIEAIARIEHNYLSYVATKDRVIDHYKRGQREEGVQLHRTTRTQFAEVLKLCEEFRAMHYDAIRRTQARSNDEARRLRYIAVMAVTLSSILVILLSLILARKIIAPLKSLLRDASGRANAEKPGNIVSELSSSVHGLIRNADQIRQELERSREHLVQAEKMAMVGKLAAGMAHSIRNPFTSVKMRLFSLNRAIKLTDAQKEDFEVISQEIRHIDNIVQNFLEFSRPPKLSMQLVSPSIIVDTTLRLLAHRLKSYNVNTMVARNGELPKVYADPEQLKEVLVNIMINACEAMTEGGRIVIEESVNGTEHGSQVRLKITDTGSGIDPVDLEKIFQPFFTTKDDGTGLGLSIARRIMEEHGGTISIRPTGGPGACFEMILPLPMEKQGEHDPHH